MTPKVGIWLHGHMLICKFLRDAVNAVGKIDHAAIAKYIHKMSLPRLLVRLNLVQMVSGQKVAL